MKTDFQIVSEMFEKQKREFIKDFPIWMKCNVLLNQIGTKTDKEINWDYVNEVLNDNTDELHYNLFDEIHSLQELVDLARNSKSAEVPEFGEPYFGKTCKVCKDNFTLTKGEIISYLGKGLKIPGKCYYCRKGIEKPKPQIIKEETEVEEVPKTAFQLAFEAAGIK